MLICSKAFGRGGFWQHPARAAGPWVGRAVPIPGCGAGSSCSSRRRRSACPSSPAPGAVIQQKALELVTKVWMWAGKYSPVS